MKRLTALFLALFMITASAQYKNEMRAVWLTNVDSNVLFSDTEIAKAMDFLASVGVNVVFPVVWNKGYTLYPSQVMQNTFGVSIIPQFAGRDPLEKVILEGHRVGIEVIPWFEFGFSSSYSLSGGHIVAAKPHWAGKDNQGNLLVKNGFDWLSGINPEVQDFMLSLITEVMDKYDVDGVQGDDRLPAMPIEGGYDSVTVSIYKAENNGANPPQNPYDLNWKKWRAGKLNSFLARLRDTVKVRGDQMILSVAPSVYPWGYDNYLQDSKSWIDSSLLDNFIPQLYRQDIVSYRYELGLSLNYVPQEKRNIFFAGVLAKAGSYVMTPSLLSQSVRENRFRGVAGESYFFYEAFKANSVLADTLKALYSDPAVPPFRNGKIWRPKAELINEDSTGYASFSGNWVRSNVQGYQTGIYWTNDTADAEFYYNFDVKWEAYYDVYAYMVPNFIFTDFARYTLYGASDSSTTVVSQRNSANSRWVKIGTVYLTPGNKRVIKIDNKDVEQGKYLLADAVMLMLNRKLSPDVVITDIQNEETESGQPDSYRLMQNYPNPFNPETTIRFSLKNSGSATLKIYDLLGREVRTLINGELQSGSYSINFDSKNDFGGLLSSGVYFYTLKTGDFSSTKKMVLLR